MKINKFALKETAKNRLKLTNRRNLIRNVKTLIKIYLDLGKK